MASRIRILPDLLVNRIAAGEVIERPASIIKELADNALDARSSRIIIRIADGGKSLISVSDDGEGMPPDDALLAFERYATSKLSEESDLEKIATLGFRGEALPSIAAVSRVRLTTRAAEGAGTELSIENGRVTENREAARGRGTEIEVRDLFASVPARKKFLKSTPAELAASSAIVNQLALSHFHVGFEFFHQGKLLFQYSPVPSLRERIFQVFGDDVLDKLVSVSGDENDGMSVDGFVSLPPNVFPARGYQEVFVNRRPVRNPAVSHAISEAYRSYLMKGENPFYVLFLEVDPARVDVNVHPSKKEVRFSDTPAVHRLVFERLRGILRSRSGTPLAVSSGVPGFGALTERSESRVNEKSPDYSSGLPASPEPAFVAGRGGLFEDQASGGQPADFFHVLGQFREMFLLIQEGDSLQMIDQHAAHERVLYERLLSQISRDSIPVQPFLVPRQVVLSADEMVLFDEIEESFRQLGFDIDKFGERSLLVRSSPAFLGQADLSVLISDILEEAISFKTVSSDKERYEKMIAAMACHGSVRAGQKLGEREIASLYRDLKGTEGALTCPHGRPIRKVFTLKDLEKLFRRTA